MTVILKSPEKMILRSYIGHSLANAIRRTVEEIPTLAIDEVEIFKNDGALYDEVLAHRLGLVPLRTEGKMGPKTETNLTIKKTGPGKVYSGDLTGGSKVVFDKIPLTILEDKQEIELVATARLGTGLDHTKYVPGLIFYRPVLEVKSGNVKIDTIIQNSKGVIKPEKKGSNWLCDLNEAEMDEVIAIDKNSLNDTKELLIFVESFGHLDAEKIFTRAIDVLNKNLEEFEKQIK